MKKMKENREKNKDKRNVTVYVVQNSANLRTYLGVTCDELHRLMQHNGLTKGGAWNTKLYKGTGEWVFAHRVQNLTRFEARSLEAKTKFWKKKKGGIKGEAHEKWVKVIQSLIDGYPEAYMNYEIETLDILEEKYGKKKYRKKPGEGDEEGLEEVK